MIRAVALALMFFVAFSIAHAQVGIPTKETIVEWWNQPERVQIGDIKKITLIGGETAYLASAEFVDRGRNFSRGVLLARPSLNKAIDLSSLIDSEFDIIKLGSYPFSASYIVSTPWASGQGTYEGKKTLLYFNGWEPIVVLVRKESDNLGVNADSCPSASRRFEWKFVDLNNDKALDLIEVRIDEKRVKPDCQLKTLKATRRYRNTEPEFVPMGPASIEKD